MNVKTNHLEPGLLQVFRWYSALRLIILFLSGFSMLWGAGPKEPDSFQVNWINLALALALIGYLFWQPIQKQLGKYFLPLGIVLAVIGPEVEQYLTLRQVTENGPYQPLAGAWQLVPLLLVPLIVVGAQYRFRTVVIYSAGTYLIDLLIILATVGNFGRDLFPTLSVLSIRTISFLLVGYSIVQLIASQRKQRQELTLANQQIAHYASTLEQLTISRERNRLARELHDTLAHSLSGVAVQLEAVKSEWEENPENAKGMLEQALGTTRSGLTETRRALQALRATPIDDLGLGLAVKSLVESVMNRSGLAIAAEIGEDVGGISPEEEQCVYRVAQETLENIVRHAEATRVTLKLEKEGGKVKLRISDDGKGFDVEQVSVKEKYGLSGMRERTEEAGGKLEIVSRAGVGTAVELTVGGRL